MEITMKKLLLPLLLLSTLFSGGAIAQTDFEKIDNHVANSNRLHTLSSRICNAWYGEPDIPDYSNQLIVEYLVKHNLPKPTPENIAHFLNTNKNNGMTCSDGSNYIKRAIVEDHYKPFIYKYIIKRFRKTNPQFDFNAVDMFEGKPESVLDFIDRILAGKHPERPLSTQYEKEVKRLRRALEITFGALKFEDFSPEMKAEYLNKQHHSAPTPTR